MSTRFPQILNPWADWKSLPKRATEAFMFGFRWFGLPAASMDLSVHAGFLACVTATGFGLAWGIRLGRIDP